jgi:hypothetical protein
VIAEMHAGLGVKENTPSNVFFPPEMRDETEVLLLGSQSNPEL